MVPMPLPTCSAAAEVPAAVALRLRGSLVPATHRESKRRVVRLVDVATAKSI